MLQILLAGCILTAIAFAIKPKQVSASRYFGQPKSLWGLNACMLYGIVSVFAPILAQSWSFGQVGQTLIRGLFVQETALAVLIVPFYEEFLFRGALMSRVNLAIERRGLTPILFWVLYVNALIFWVAHFPLSPDAWSNAWKLGGIPVGPGPFLLGLVCAWIAYKDQSIWCAILFHAFANWFGVLWIEVLQKPELIRLFYQN